MKRITMVFPNGKDTLKIGEDMVAHFDGMGYKVKADSKGKTAKKSQAVQIENYMQELINSDPERENKANWTKDDVPDANVMSEVLGFEVSAQMRDKHWEQIS